jgi:predicted metal-dependent phosphotriesterase family hydrolase
MEIISPQAEDDINQRDIGVVDPYEHLRVKPYQSKLNEANS